MVVIHSHKGVMCYEKDENGDIENEIVVYNIDVDVTTVVVSVLSR